MNKVKKTNGKNKISYLKPGFIIPMVYSVFTAILMGLVYAVSEKKLITDPAMVQMIMQAGMISITFSPPALVLCGPMAYRHKNKYPLESVFYSELPFFLTILVLGFQVLYLILSQRMGA